MNQRTFATHAVVALCLAFGSTASAQDIPSSYDFVDTRQEFGWFYGYGDSSTGALGLGPKPGTIIGGRYSVEFGSALALEANGRWMFSGRDVFDPRREVGNEVIGEAQQDIATVEARVRVNLTGHRTWNRLQPYMSFGGGFAFEGLQDRTLEDEAGFLPSDVYEFGTRFLATIGTGVALHLTSRLAIRADANLNLWRINTPDGFLDATRDIPFDATAVAPEEWVSVKLLTIGTSWRF